VKSVDTTTLSRPTPALIVVLGTLTAFGALSIDMYLPGLPAIARDLGADPSLVQLTLSLFFIGLAAGQALYGPLSDRFGRKRPLLIGCALYALASAACALAPTAEALIVARLAQALGGSAGMVIARSVVRDRFDARESARVFSLLMLVMGLAPITAPLIGGQLLVFFGWRAIFWVLCGFGLLCLLMVSRALPESLPPERRSGAGLGAALAVYGRLIADRRFLGYALAGGLTSAAMFAYIAGSPFVVIELYGISPQQFGWIFGANALGLILASQLNRRLLASFPGDTIVRATLLLSAGAALLLTLAAATGFGGLPGLLAPLFVCVAAGGLVGPNTTAAALVPHGKAAGSASALLGAISFLIGTGTSALVAALHNGTALPMAGVMAACIAGALASYLTLASTSSRSAASPTAPEAAAAATPATRPAGRSRGSRGPGRS
jgi:DHA1 family bicyclomycin/chloramphenicol resistance-like MFS transporter